MLTHHFLAKDATFDPNETSLRKIIYMDCMYLLAPFIAIIFKKSLEHIQSYEDVPFLDRDMYKLAQFWGTTMPKLSI